MKTYHTAQASKALAAPINGVRNVAEQGRVEGERLPSPLVGSRSHRHAVATPESEFRRLYSVACLAEVYADFMGAR